MPNNRKRGLIALSILAGVIIGMFLVNWFSSRAGKVAIKVYVAPSIATVTVDGKKSGAGTIYVSKGSHVIAAKADGFSENSKTISAPSDIPVTLTLSPQSTAAHSYAKKHQDEYLRVEGIVSDTAAQKGTDYVRNNPIMSFLPYRNSLYNIDYGNGADGSLTIYISASTAMGRQVAIERIRSWGLDPTNYTIVFSNFSNPFEQGGAR